MTKARSFRGFNTAGLAFLPFLHASPQTLPMGPGIGTEQPMHRVWGIDDYKARYNPDGDVEAPMASNWYAVYGDKGSGKTQAGRLPGGC